MGGLKKRMDNDIMDTDERKYFTELFKSLSKQLGKYEERLRSVEELVAVHQNLCKEHSVFREDISDLQEDVAHINGSLSGKYVAVGIIMSLLNLLLVAILVFVSVTNGSVI